MSKKFNGHRCEKRNLAEVVLGLKSKSKNRSKAKPRPKNYTYELGGETDPLKPLTATSDTNSGYNPLIAQQIERAGGLDALQQNLAASDALSQLNAMPRISQGDFEVDEDGNIIEDNPSLLEMAANPITTARTILDPSVEGMPSQVEFDQAKGKGTIAGQVANDLVNPAAWVNYGKNALRDASQGNFIGAGLNALGAIPGISITGAGTRQALKQAGVTGVKNLYKANPALKNPMGFRNVGDKPHFLFGYNKPIDPMRMDLNPEAGFNQLAEGVSRNNSLNWGHADRLDAELYAKTPFGEQLGSGGFGTVHEFKNSPYAIKFPHQEFSNPNAVLPTSRYSGTTDDFIARTSEIADDMPNVAAPLRSQNDLTIMRNLQKQEAVPGAPELPTRDAYASALKQVRQLRDRGIGLDLDNIRGNINYNKNTGQFDFYDLENVPQLSASSPKNLQQLQVRYGPIRPFPGQNQAGAYTNPVEYMDEVRSGLGVRGMGYPDKLTGKRAMEGVMRLKTNDGLLRFQTQPPVSPVTPLKLDIPPSLQKHLNLPTGFFGGTMTKPRVAPPKANYGSPVSELLGMLGSQDTSANVGELTEHYGQFGDTTLAVPTGMSLGQGLKQHILQPRAMNLPMDFIMNNPTLSNEQQLMAYHAQNRPAQPTAGDPQGNGVFGFPFQDQDTSTFPLFSMNDTGQYPGGPINNQNTAGPRNPEYNQPLPEQSMNARMLSYPQGNTANYSQDLLQPVLDQAQSAGNSTPFGSQGSMADQASNSMNASMPALNIPEFTPVPGGNSNAPMNPQNLEGIFNQMQQSGGLNSMIDNVKGAAGQEGRAQLVNQLLNPGGTGIADFTKMAGGLKNLASAGVNQIVGKAADTMTSGDDGFGTFAGNALKGGAGALMLGIPGAAPIAAIAGIAGLVKQRRDRRLANEADNAANLQTGEAVRGALADYSQQVNSVMNERGAGYNTVANYGGAMNAPQYETEGGEMMMASPQDPPMATNNGNYKQVASNMYQVQGPKHESGGVLTQGATESYIDPITGQPVESPYVFSDATDMKIDASEFLKMIS